MDIRRILSDLISRGAEFVVYTDIMYGRGINGVGFVDFCSHEKIGSSDLKTDVVRIFDLKDDHIEIIENYTPPKIPWNRNAEKPPYTLKKYIGYERVTYIKETIES